MYNGGVIAGDPYAIFTLIVNLILTFVIIFLERKQPSSTYAWLLFLWVFPYFGFIFYLLFSQRFSSHRVYHFKKNTIEKINEAVTEQAKEIQNGIPEDSPLYRFREYRDNIEYQNNVSHALFTADNAVEILTDGTELFERLLEDCENATSSINIEFYIFKNDQIGRTLMDVLKRKAAEGVQVRVLYDEMGSRLLKYYYVYKMKKAGIAMSPFMPSKFGPIAKYVQIRLNYRDHRKICVIDGKIGYIGGFNVGDEYLGRYNKFGYWRDTHLRIRGSAVAEMQSRFLQDWNTTKEEIPGKPVEENLKMLFPPIEPAGDVGIQIVASGPDTVNQNIKQGYLKMINDAKERILITSPYFVLDESVNEALKIALLSGVEVSILIPDKPDHPFILPTTMSYAGALIPYGAKVYQYRNGFVHSKLMVVDQELSVIGSCNFDIRSFSLNFECSAFVYDKEVNRKLAEDFEHDLKLSKRYTLENYRHRSQLQIFRESISRLLSPLL